MTSYAVTVVGIGRMGLPIARHLDRAGHIVTVFDRDPQRMSLAVGGGVKAAESAATAAADADVLVTVLPGAPECEGVMRERGGVMDILRPGSCWLDLTSNDPRVAARIAGSAAARGVDAVGAPMGGGVIAAEAAQLEFFVGGSASARERVRPLLRALAREEGVRVAGDDISSGYTAKLLINLLWFGQVAAVTEALLLGERLGLPAGRMRDLLAGSAADSAFVRRHLDPLLAGDDLVTFGLQECVDELDIVMALADEYGTPFEVSALVTRLHHEALARFGPVDGELMVARLLEERSGIELRGELPTEGI